jgi:putative Mn2+ efflux pump MntP
MTTLTILTLSVGLAMDAMAVSAARGCAARALRARDVWRVALFFGGFQALMPMIGWLLGDAFGGVVSAWDHWIAFVLLGAIGAKMLWEARTSSHPVPSDGGPQTASGDDLFAPRVLLVLAIATSIDALAAGITLPMLGAPLLLSVASIGLVTAALSALGIVAGRRFGDVLGRRLDVFGGLVLMALGAKILVEHLALL